MSEYTKEIGHTTIAGLDLSINGSGCVKYYLDGNGKIVHRDWLSFHGRQTASSPNDHFIRLKDTKTIKRDFANKFEQNIFTTSKIIQFCSDCDLVGIEEYAFGGGGLDFDIAEFIGTVKAQLYAMGTPFKIYNITKIKQIATGNGNAGKPDMDKAFQRETQDDEYATFKDLWEHLEPGKHPHEDLVDAYWILQMATLDIGYIKGIFDEEDFRNISEKTWEVFFKDVRVKKKGKPAYFNPSVAKQGINLQQRLYKMKAHELKSKGATIKGYEGINTGYER